jgi:hypothetical protein
MLYLYKLPLLDNAHVKVTLSSATLVSSLTSVMLAPSKSVDTNVDGITLNVCAPEIGLNLSQ